MVRYEGVITTLIGATLGLAPGVFLAGLTTAAIDGATFTVPTGQLAAMAIIGGVLGVIAAVAPARRATVHPGTHSSNAKPGMRAVRA